MKIVIIDNYDSFTYNLSHLVKELGAEVTVLRNDQFKLEDLEPYSKIILSPGPGIPSEAGLLLDVIKSYAGKKPILGVCLGHQAIGEAFGGKLENLSDVFHGVATPCHITVEDPHLQWHRAKYHHRSLPLVGGIKREPARLLRGNRRERRRTDYGPAPQNDEHPRHTVPPRERTDTRRQENAAKLDVSLTLNIKD